MSKLFYFLAEEPKGEDIWALMKVATKYCTFFTLTLRPFHDGREPANVLSLLEPFALSRVRSGGWPGTDPADGTLLTYRFCLNAAALLAGTNPRLYCWQGIGYPEDLCLYRPDGTVWLASIAHEQEGFTVLEPEEHAAVREQASEIRLEPAPVGLVGDLGSKNWLGGLINGT